MPARQSILLLVLCVLIGLPAGVAKAEIDVDNGDTRVRIGDYGGIRVERDDDDDSYYRYRRVPSRSTRVRAPQSRIERLRNLRLRYPRSTRSYQSCKGRNITQQRTVTSSSGSGSNRTYSSTTTTTCR